MSLYKFLIFLILMIYLKTLTLCLIICYNKENNYQLGYSVMTLVIHDRNHCSLNGNKSIN